MLVQKQKGTSWHFISRGASAWKEEETKIAPRPLLIVWTLLRRCTQRHLVILSKHLKGYSQLSICKYKGRHRCNLTDGRISLRLDDFTTGSPPPFERPFCIQGFPKMRTDKWIQGDPLIPTQLIFLCQDFIFDRGANISGERPISTSPARYGIFQT